jgi:glycosyltransferase involved in cell wall biosynthesis
MKSDTVLWMVIPCYNEEIVLKKTAPMFLKEMNQMVASGLISDNSRILFVNDGSSDSTWSIIQELSKQDRHFIGIAQSRNRGHQNAVLAGLMEAMDQCDITISIDCDGQDDIHAMEEMVRQYHSGSDIVYGVRNNRDTDSWFKRTTAQSYYKLLNKMDVEVVYNHADYRLVSSKVLHHFADFHEVNLFLRGMFPLVGFRSTCVYYKREERIAGDSHYPLSKMLHLAFDGITSLSIKPIQIIAGFGLLISFIGIFGIIWVIIRALLGYTLAGWASMICVVVFLGGVQMLSLGVIGTYVGKTYMETKHRPRYIISDRTWKKETDCKDID